MKHISNRSFLKLGRAFLTTLPFAGPAAAQQVSPAPTDLYVAKFRIYASWHGHDRLGFIVDKGSCFQSFHSSAGDGSPLIDRGDMKVTAYDIKTNRSYTLWIQSSALEPAPKGTREPACKATLNPV